MRHVNAIGMSWKTGHYISTLLYSEIYRAKKLSLVTEDRETSLGVCSPRERHPKDTPDNGTLTEYRDAVIRLQYHDPRDPDATVDRTDPVVTQLCRQLRPALEVELPVFPVESIGNADVQHAHGTTHTDHVDRLEVTIQNENVCIKHDSNYFLSALI